MNKRRTLADGTRVYHTQVLHPGIRDQFGATVTFKNERGELLTIERLGTMKVALAACCDAALELDPTYRVLSVSSPQSIYTDLQGSRPRQDERPEKRALASIGRQDLLHPSLALVLCDGRSTFEGQDAA